MSFLSNKFLAPAAEAPAAEAPAVSRKRSHDKMDSVIAQEPDGVRFRVDLLEALWKRSKPASFFQSPHCPILPPPFDYSSAADEVNHPAGIDYFCGRVIKMNLSALTPDTAVNELSTGGYNLDNGEGAAEMVFKFVAANWGGPEHVSALTPETAVNELSTVGYNRDNGEGAAELVLIELG